MPRVANATAACAGVAPRQVQMLAVKRYESLQNQRGQLHDEFYTWEGIPAPEEQVMPGNETELRSVQRQLERFQQRR